jgi:hypothetical protein
MRTILMRFGGGLLGALCLSACGTVAVVPHAMKCDASAALLAAHCAQPAQLAVDATFASMVDALRSDRQALRECALAVDALRDSLNRCNQATDDFNRKIDAINARQRAD